MTADCMACAAQTTVEEICADDPTITGCPPAGPICCQAMTADCMACAAQTTVEEICADDPTITGCSMTDGPPVCCLAITAECIACSLSTTVESFCQQNPIVPGCPDIPNGEECCVEDAAEVCSSLPFLRSALIGMTTDHTEVGVTYDWQSGACHESHMECCWDQSQLGCLACSHGVAPEDFCATADAVDHAD